jgi:hypothetical protein
MKKHKKKKSFHKVRNFRISDEVFLELIKYKKGTWNYFFNELIKLYGDVSVSKMSKQQMED